MFVACIFVPCSAITILLIIKGRVSDASRETISSHRFNRTKDRFSDVRQPLFSTNSGPQFRRFLCHDQQSVLDEQTAVYILYYVIGQVSYRDLYTSFLISYTFINIDRDTT